MFSEIYTICDPHHHDPQFIYLFYFQVFLTDSRSPILDPSFPVNPEVLLMKIVLFFDHWSNQLFQSNQRFQTTEFVKRPIPKPLDSF